MSQRQINVKEKSLNSIKGAIFQVACRGNVDTLIKQRVYLSSHTPLYIVGKSRENCGKMRVRVVGEVITDYTYYCLRPSAKESRARLTSTQ